MRGVVSDHQCCALFDSFVMIIRVGILNAFKVLKDPITEVFIELPSHDRSIGNIWHDLVCNFPRIDITCGTFDGAQIYVWIRKFLLEPHLEIDVKVFKLLLVSRL